jgi:hypothetical protein
MQWGFGSVGSCGLDENGDFVRDRRMPIYEEIDCIDIEQARMMRDNWLRTIGSGKLSDSNCYIAQMLVDDLDFLIRGGVLLP